MGVLKKFFFKIIEKLSPELAENVKGDLEEMYREAMQRHGKWKASLLFILECLTCFKLMLNKENWLVYHKVNLSSGLKMSWRVLVKNRSYSLISIGGLTIGLTVCMMIFLFVRTELSYDRYHQKADRIYRLVYDLTDRNEKLPWAIIRGRWAAMMADQFFEVEDFVRITTTWGSKSLMKSKKITSGLFEDGFMWADSSIVDVFDFEIIAGNTINPIAEPHSMMVSEEIAIKYFGSIEEALGSNLNRDNETDYTISAVFKVMPVATHFHAQMIASYMTGTTPEQRNQYWSYSYLVLKEGVDPASLSQQFPELIKTHIPTTPQPKIHLQPVTSIYLNSQLMYEFEPVGDKTTIQMFIGVGIFILLIACINFINLSTAYGARRVKEIGIKKVMGAYRQSLIGQLIVECVIITCIAVVLACFIGISIIPYIETLIGKSLDVSLLWTYGNVLIMIGSILIIGVLSGAYPAFYISAFNPREIFAKGRSRSKQYLRKGLSIFQFTMSISLIAASIVVYQQLQYFQNKDMGMLPDQALVVPLDYSGQLLDSYDAFRSEAMQHPGVMNMSLMSNLPGELIRMWVGDIRAAEASEDEKIRVKFFTSDYDFVNTLGIRIKEGRDYSRLFSTDSTHAVLINETAAELLGITDIDGASIYSYNTSLSRNMKVIGIVEDFHFASLHNAIEPLVIYNNPGTANKGKLVIRVKTEEVKSTVEHIESVWGKFESDRIFESYFLNDYFQTKYTKEQTTMNLLVVFTFLAIIIACLGLFGLATYVMQNRLKEVGIRKVLGASTSQMWVLLSVEFVWLVFIAFVLATPLIYFMLDRWLANFAYRIDLSILVFVLAMLAVILPALITISIQSIKVAKANPTDILIDE